MKQLCVIGWPVSHSKSPLLHGAMLREMGLPYEYTARPVEPERLEEFLRLFKAEDFAGCNVTMPFKEAILPYLDELDPLAEKLQAVNTVCNRNGKLYGYNTDCPGFTAALVHEGFGGIEGREAVVLGAGGAAKAVALGLCQAGARRVWVANRTAAKAEALAALEPTKINLCPWDTAALSAAAEGADLLVNATSLGMAGQGQFSDFAFLAALKDSAWVSDLIYHPAETELLRRAKARGLATMNGMPLLMHQAILALEHFTGAKLDPARMVAVMEKALEESV